LVLLLWLQLLLAHAAAAATTAAAAAAATAARCCCCCHPCHHYLPIAATTAAVHGKVSQGPCPMLVPLPALMSSTASDLEVLSVVAQAGLLALQAALKSGAERFLFEGHEIVFAQHLWRFHYHEPWVCWQD